MHLDPSNEPPFLALPFVYLWDDAIATSLALNWGLDRHLVSIKCSLNSSWRGHSWWSVVPCCFLPMLVSTGFNLTGDTVQSLGEPRPLLLSRGVLKWAGEAPTVSWRKGRLWRNEEGNKSHWTEAVTVIQAMPLLSNYLVLLPYIMRRRWRQAIPTNNQNGRQENKSTDWVN